ncbi:mechanosensitive ion channel protein MscS [Desulfuromonas versatilis]|uniref:Mechanosensitive ion channel protein MscS n=1 Tax=Desulfuromonas versatilis TaxID=2802975 RepID=A0ABN6E345_9BACT|nr:mechanosensitive ion channel protein MscS [Desulfuromonas versatilis]
MALALLLTLAAPPALRGQQQAGPEPEPLSVEPSPTAPERVGVEKVSSDRAIDRRLTGILESTGWFEQVEVEVREGVVFLDGLTRSAERRDWAGALAGKTEDVVAVVNRVRVAERSPWDLTPAAAELQRLGRLTVQKLPAVGIGLLILIITGILAKLVAAGARRVLESRMKPLLRDVTARALSIPILILGVYLVLQVAGLTRLATTVLGGTGLFGLVAGIAFRDILENFLASILISMRNPFKLGDLVEVAGHLGVVQRVTSRGTVLMDPDGNHVQIPNATIYKSIIRNFTANPNRRESFEVGIGYENDSAAAQAVALEVLNGHPAVLKDPEALVLVDRLGAATVNLRVYFWYDGSAYNGPKVKSSLIRLVKRAFEGRGISMPDEAREIVFPDGVPVRMLEAAEPPAKKPRPEEAAVETGAVTTAAEGHLANEEGPLREQARRARMPEEGASLLEEKNPR